MAYKTASPEQAKKLTAATKHLTPHLKAKNNLFKSLLPANLAADYNLCYWGDDGCQYCSDDGVNWVCVQCIT